MEMRDMMWIYAAFLLLSSEAWSQDLGTNQSTTVNPNTSSPPPKVSVVRNVTFNPGSDVDLTCSNKTWNETMFVIWNIHRTKYKDCKISLSDDGQSVDTCNDGKSLRNTSSARSYLRIPNFSNKDVGVYKCEWVYRGGTEDHLINVAITVSPSVSSWLERKGNKTVAVCKAEGGKPAANISWIHIGNSSVVTTLLESHGLFTVESHLELSEGMDTEKPSCAITHVSWKEQRILIPKRIKSYVPWLCIFTVVVIVVFSVGFLVFAHKNLTLRRCQQSNRTTSKSAPTEDVEEVEPYASYVQRVNSIYNSSADLFR